MDQERYDGLIDQLERWAGADKRVCGVVAVGSTARLSRHPDTWSDHDVLIVTRPGSDQQVRHEASWLPDADRVALRFLEPDHGVTVIYDDGHLAEFAVCDLDRIQQIPLAEARVVAGDPRVASAIADTVAATLEPFGAGTDGRYEAHRCLKELVVGLHRLGRGERLSANERIRGAAVRHLLTAWGAQGSDPDPLLDPLDPHRRAERRHPDLARRLARAVDQPLDVAAFSLLEILSSDVLPRLGSTGSSPTSAAVGAVRCLAERVQASVASR